MPVTLEDHSLFQISTAFEHKFSPPEDPVPDEVAYPATTKLRMFFTFQVESKRDFGVDPDTKIVIHYAPLFKSAPELLKKLRQKLVTTPNSGSFFVDFVPLPCP